MNIDAVMRLAPVIPALVLDDSLNPTALAEILVEAGLPVIEVTMRTPFSDARFCPTGGIREETAPQWLDHRSVLCVGGSWLVQPGEADLAAISDRARRAAKLAGHR